MTMKQNCQIPLLLILFMSLVPFVSRGQQDPLFIQYDMYKHLVNPAMTGIRSSLSISTLHRIQWVGIDGAPQTTAASISQSLNNGKLGLGLSVLQDQIGPSKQQGAYIDIATRIEFRKRRYLSFGVKAGVNHLSANISTLSSIDPNDPAIQGDINRFLPNIGLGVFYHDNTFYAGYSLPKTIRNYYYPSNPNSTAREVFHHFFMVGALIKANRRFWYKPSAQVKLVQGAKPSAELGLHVIIDQSFWISPYYRTDKSLGLSVAFQITDILRFSYSYDYPFQEYNTLTSGSHEFGFIMDMVFGYKGLSSPRYF